MIDVTRPDDPVLHEGRRLGRGRARPLVVFRQLSAAGALAMLVVTLMGSVPLRFVPAVYAGYLLLVGTPLLGVARGRLRITRHHIVERNWRGQRVVRRAEVAQVVVVQSLLVLGQDLDCILLLDRMGRRLWRSPLGCWPDSTVTALLDSGPRVTTVAVATPAEVEERWPDTMPGSVLHPRRTVLLMVLAVMVVAVPLGLVAEIVLG